MTVIWESPLVSHDSNTAVFAALSVMVTDDDPAITVWLSLVN